VDDLKMPNVLAIVSGPSHLPPHDSGGANFFIMGLFLVIVVIWVAMTWKK
jgi:hypothetical protein